MHIKIIDSKKDKSDNSTREHCITIHRYYIGYTGDSLKHRRPMTVYREKIDHER